jgi:hypothetical protein
MNIFREFIIFFNTPRTFHHWRIQDFLPPVQTLNISPQMKERCDSFPVFGTESLNQLCKLLVFFRIPISLIIMWILICNNKCVYVLLSLNCLIRRIHILSALTWILWSFWYHIVAFWIVFTFLHFLFLLIFNEQMLLRSQRLYLIFLDLIHGFFNQAVNCKSLSQIEYIYLNSRFLAW